jgi:rfaE bifunctional protein kinase chain/domain
MSKIIDEIILNSNNRKRIVLVTGTFNIVHPGHLRLLRFAAECGDYLVVGVLSDEISTNAQLNQETRLDGVKAISWVNYAFILNFDVKTLISELKPSVVVKGKEHEVQENPEVDILNEYGGKLMFGSGDMTFSSLELLKNETELVNHSSILKPREYLEHHGINFTDFAALQNDIKKLNICVIGDTIVDEYIQCDPLGMSQEDPTIVVTPILSNKFIGGSAIVAAHAKSLGAGTVNFISVTGEDNERAYVLEKLKEYGVNATLFSDDSRMTTHKQRYRVGNKTLLRVSHLRQHKISKTLQQKVIDRTSEILNKADLLIFSDFNYGMLPQELVNLITAECNRKNIMVVADSQSSSQTGDVSRFKNAALLTPTEREARIALGNYEDGLVVLAELLRKKTNAENIVITLGAEGLLIHANVKGMDKWMTDRLPALNILPKDTAGAGDCLLVCAAIMMILGKSIWESIYIGSIAAACQVGRIGNYPLSTKDLFEEILKNNKL